MRGMDKITWPAAFVVAAALAAIVGLVSLGQDLTAVGVLIAGLLYGNSLQQSGTKADVAEVKTQVNGNNRYLVEAALDREREMRAMLTAALAALPAGTVLPLLSQPAHPDVPAGDDAYPAPTDLRG